MSASKDGSAQENALPTTDSSRSDQSLTSKDGAREYRIRGGRSLNGTVTVAGAKNAISKQLVASLLTSEECFLSNVPRIAEINAILDMLSEVGMNWEWTSTNTLRVQTPRIENTHVSQKYSGFNRIPILMLSPLLHRAGEASVPTVGGCKIGPRPVDFHLAAIQQLGADIDSSRHGYSATSSGLRGAVIVLLHLAILLP